MENVTKIFTLTKEFLANGIIGKDKFTFHTHPILKVT